MKIKTVIIEDDFEIRQRIQRFIDQSSTCECIGSFSNGEEALKSISDLKPNVALVDIGLPGISGIEVIKKLKPISPEIQFMICSVVDDQISIFQALEAGATGYLLKNTPLDKILNSIEDLHNGGSPMSSEIARKVLQTFYQPAKNSVELTIRENEILNLLAKGLRYKEIAEKLFISLDTVRSHVRNTYEKLHVSTRTQAILKVSEKK